MRIFLLLSFSAGVFACTKTNPDLCCTSETDCASLGVPVGTDCAAGLVCRGNQCIAELCSASADCDAAAPYCATNTCIESCVEDSQCPGFGGDASTPFCELGSCVACRLNTECPTSAGICDAGACRGCKQNSECSSGLCEVAAMTCIPEAQIAYATVGGASSGPCTQTQPCTATFAFASTTPSRFVEKLAHGMYSDFAFPVTDGRAVTVYGEQSTVVVGSELNTGMVRFLDLTLSGSILCRPVTNGTVPILEFDNVDLTDTASVYGSPCKLSVRHSRTRADGSLIIQAAAGSTVVIDSSTFDNAPIGVFGHSSITITNSVFTNAGSTGALLYNSLDDNAANSISFSTFHNSKLTCSSGTNQFQLKNNIFVNALPGAPADTVTGAGCTHSFSLITPQTTMVGSTNKLNLDAFFVAPNTSDFHLQAISPAIDAADPASTLAADFDGTARPQGAARDMGAFEHH